MKKQIVCLAIILMSTIKLMGQFGVSLQYYNFPVILVEEKVAANVYDLNYGVAVDYWMRLKNYRWEMVPTVSIHTGNKSETTFNENTTFGLQAYKFHFKNNLYLLDFKNDCDCPTFSKQGGLFQKSFFVQVAPGYGFYQLKAENGTISKEQKHVGELGIGAGFDFGLSDLITISPYFNYVLTTKIDYDYLSEANESFNTRMNHFVAGIRLGLRPDYARPSNKRRRALRY